VQCGVKSGIVVLDKPAGPSSAQALGRLKRILAARKAGHAGTLDPAATGVLVCCLEQATRLAGLLLAGSKTYEALLQLGTETDTLDAGGAVTRRRPVPPLTAAELERVLEAFRGEIRQAPPVFSALKHHGRPLYQLARSGQMIQKPPRPVTVHALTLLGIDLPAVRLRVHCSAGTYVRSLCAAIGETLGCGGHLAALRRTECCGFNAAQALAPAELERHAAAGEGAAVIIPMADALPEMPEHRADGGLARRIACGAALRREEVWSGSRESEATLVKVVDDERRLLAVVQLEKGTDHCRYRCVFHPGVDP
jgi:tRNA pseudouridine55 synthase